MLSSVAERVYWLGRYLERAENSARLIKAYSTLLFDLPASAHMGWGTLLDINGSTEQYREHHEKTDEKSIMKFLITDSAYYSSIFSSVKLARENARTAREVIPNEAWEEINELYLLVKEAGGVHIYRGKRQALLSKVIAHCQLLAGLLSGCMTHNTAYAFIHLGRKLERADMTTRIVDVGSIALLPELKKATGGRDLSEPYAHVIWMNVLRCLSAYQAYRQHVQNRVEGDEVVRYLLQDEDFPRSVRHCLSELNVYLQKLPNHENVLRAVARVQRISNEVNIRELLDKGVLVQFIDELQISIADIHEELSRTWFRPAVETLVQAQGNNPSSTQTQLEKA